MSHLRAVLRRVICIPVVRCVHASVAVDHLQYIHFTKVRPAACSVRHHPVRGPYALGGALAAGGSEKLTPQGEIK